MPGDRNGLLLPPRLKPEVHLTHPALRSSHAHFRTQQSALVEGKKRGGAPKSYHSATLEIHAC